MPNINLINGLDCPKKVSAKYFLSVEISRPKVKKMVKNGFNEDFNKIVFALYSEAS